MNAAPPGARAPRRSAAPAAITLAGAALAAVLVLSLAALAATIGGVGAGIATVARSRGLRRLGAGGALKSRPHTCACTCRPPAATAWTGRSSRGSARSSATTGATPRRRARTRASVNSAGAGGPRSSSPRPGRVYGVSADGEGPPDRWNPADAIFAMANYLRARGAPGDYRAAIYAYNHAWWYVEEVQTGPRCIGARPSRRSRPAPPVKAPAIRRHTPKGGSWPASERRAPLRCSSILGERAVLSAGQRPRRADPRGRAARGAGDGDRRQRAAGPPLRAGRAPRPAGGRRVRTARAPSTTCSTGRGAPARGNRARQPARPGLRRLGPAGSRPLGHDLRHRQPRPTTSSS